MVILGSKEDICPRLMGRMNTLRKDKTLYDVCIKVGDNQVTAHKSVLVAASDYFISLFVGPLKTGDDTAEVDFSTIVLDVESVEAVVDFLYTGVINIHEENLEAILKLTTFLLINPLEKLCIKYMEQCSDLNSFMRYYLLSVDYMVAEAEDIMVRTVKPRFHDWFIHQESTRALSPYHLQKLIEDYDIFEHCTEIDRLTFLVDWVLKGKIEEREELVLKIYDGDVTSLRNDESQSDADPQSETESQNDNDESQNNAEQQNDDKHLMIKNDEPQSDTEPQNDEETHKHEEQRCNRKSQERNEELESEEQQSDDEYQMNSLDAQRLQRLGNDIPEALEKIKNKLESTNCSQDFVKKCTEVIDYIDCEYKDDTQQTMADLTCGETEALMQLIPEPDVEHVLIAIVPKQLLKDAYKEVSQFDDVEIAKSPDDAIFEICIYIPHKLTWYYFQEGENKGRFREMAKSFTTSNLNFCLLDNLCCVSDYESRIEMFSLEHHNQNGNWASISYKDLKDDLCNPDLFGHDRNSYNVKLYSRDGKNLYLVLKITTKEATETEVKFVCYWSPIPKSWDIVAETPYIQKSEDTGIEIGSFEISVSPGNKELFIAAKGVKLHVFVVDLENRWSELKYHIIEGDEEKSHLDKCWGPLSDIYVLDDGKHISFIEEVELDGRIYYRHRTVDNTGNMAVERDVYDWIDTRLPSDNHEFRTPVKLSWSVGDGTSLWLYLSDGKFKTSLMEIRPDENGFIEHIPPPFSAVTMMAAGKVKSEHLADLKPMTDFLH